MTLALILFAFTYCLMLALPRFRPFEIGRAHV